ncbi:FAD binding domain-containing protein [Moelleriella libera RCEF 2490]|uniref:FAD binding domain-containing protein n=1 Tax=Moelleriella libera RCEF 2490 TaxID=1081109 RepID=A0A167VHS2_9HYPO|nr:FAD binding domain-containing protein [Moelleriella libera RCEF 2490]
MASHDSATIAFHAPQPGAVVNINTEADVAATIKYCASKDIPFLAQNGGSGWSSSFHLDRRGVLINLAALSEVTFDADKTRATIGRGSSVKHTIDQASAAKALILTGNCNCVGTLGAILGRGFGNMMGLYGLGVDNVLSLRLVTADDQLSTVTASSDPDLFWALRGAGPNIGIVTSAVVKSYPSSGADLMAWSAFVAFSPDKLEQVFQAIQDINLELAINILVYMMPPGPPESTEPAVIVTMFLHRGDDTAGRAAFASIFAIGPVAVHTTVLPYHLWNSGADRFCLPGGRKQSYGTGIQTLHPGTWRQVWDKYIEFQKRTTAQHSIVLLEVYPMAKVRSVASNSASSPHRHVNFQAVAVPWYTDASLDAEATAFGSAVRDLWRAADGLPRHAG